MIRSETFSDTLARTISRILALYLLRSFFGLFLLVLFGIGGVLLAFDTLANADTVLEFQDQIFAPLMGYMVLRVSAILVLVVPIAALLSAMIVFSNLVSRHEMHAMRALGVSVYRVTVILLGGGAVIAAGHFIFANTVLPQSAAALRLWENNDYRGQAFEQVRVEQDSMHWHADDRMMIHVDRANVAGDEVYDITLITRDDTGRITNIEIIPHAAYQNGVWSVPQIKNPPSVFAQTQAGQDEIRYGVLARLIEDDRGAERYGQYLSWLYAKIAHPLGTLIMILIAAPMAFQMPRRGDMVITAFGIVLAGFSYFIAEQLMLSLGETNVLPPVLAVWSPFVLAGLAGAWILLMLEG